MQISKTGSDNFFVLIWFQQPFSVFDSRSGKIQFKITMKCHNLIVFSAYSGSVKSEGRALICGDTRIGKKNPLILAFFFY
jgi:hypothetical protein